MTSLDIGRVATERVAGTGDAAERVAAELRQQILRGELRPGEKIRDSHLYTSFGVSRNTMRDAIRQLVFEGLVTTRMHSGSAVRVVTEEDARDIYTVRRSLEISAVTASSRATSDQLDAMHASIALTAKYVDEERWDDVNTSTMLFHQSIVRFIGSARLDTFFETVVAQLRLCFGYIPNRPEFHVQWLGRYRVIAEHISSGRRDEAARELAYYLDDSEAQMIDVIRSAHKAGSTDTA